MPSTSNSHTTKYCVKQHRSSSIILLQAFFWSLTQVEPHAASRPKCQHRGSSLPFRRCKSLKPNICKGSSVLPFISSILSSKKTAFTQKIRRRHLGLSKNGTPLFNPMVYHLFAYQNLITWDITWGISHFWTHPKLLGYSHPTARILDHRALPQNCRAGGTRSSCCWRAAKS